MSQTQSLEVVDSLALLSLKVATNTFDLSSGMHHVSIRDQIVRAQLLVRDLQRGDPALESLLIVGGGVAGVFAALAAADLGVKEVVVVDVADQLFSLIRNVRERFVGPFMYEWPSAFFSDQSYPSHAQTPWRGSSMSPLHWKSAEPCSASDFAHLLTCKLDQRLRNSSIASPRIFLRVDRLDVKSFVRNFVRTEAIAAWDLLNGRARSARAEFSQGSVLDYQSRTHSPLRVRPQYVILASGMGQEDCTLVKVDATGNPYGGQNFTGQAFWANDSLRDSAKANEEIYIFGGGDGAMQDALRALTGTEHPLKILDHLQKDTATKVAIERHSAGLLALDRQGRQLATWTRGPESYQAIDKGCQVLASCLAQDSNVRRRVAEIRREGNGSVTLVVREPHFGKAYMLNRFLIHLFDACCKSGVQDGTPRMDFQLYFGWQPVGYRQIGTKHEVDIQELANHNNIRPCQPDVIVVRYGIERNSVPGTQMIQLSNRPSRQRTTLSRVELPFVAG
jgi:hypothetical protein